MNCILNNNDYNYLSIKNNAKVLSFSSQTRECKAINILNKDKKYIWFSKSNNNNNKSNHFVLFDMSSIIRKDQVFCFGVYCWHGYPSNPKTIELSANYNNYNNKDFVILGLFKLEQKPGTQLFNIKEGIDLNQINQLKLIVKETHGGDKVYINNVFLYKDFPEVDLSRIVYDNNNNTNNLALDDNINEDIKTNSIDYKIENTNYYVNDDNDDYEEDDNCNNFYTNSNNMLYNEGNNSYYINEDKEIDNNINNTIKSYKSYESDNNNNDNDNAKEITAEYKKDTYTINNNNINNNNNKNLKQIQLYNKTNNNFFKTSYLVSEIEQNKDVPSRIKTESTINKIKQSLNLKKSRNNSLKQINKQKMFNQEVTTISTKRNNNKSNHNYENTTTRYFKNNNNKINDFSKAKEFIKKIKISESKYDTILSKHKIINNIKYSHSIDNFATKTNNKNNVINYNISNNNNNNKIDLYNYNCNVSNRNNHIYNNINSNPTNNNSILYKHNENEYNNKSFNVINDCNESNNEYKKLENKLTDMQNEFLNLGIFNNTNKSFNCTIKDSVQSYKNKTDIENNDNDYYYLKNKGFNPDLLNEIKDKKNERACYENITNNNKHSCSNEFEIQKDYNSKICNNCNNNYNTSENDQNINKIYNNSYNTIDKDKLIQDLSNENKILQDKITQLKEITNITNSKVENILEEINKIKHEDKIKINNIKNEILESSSIICKEVIKKELSNFKKYVDESIENNTKKTELILSNKESKTKCNSNLYNNVDFNYNDLKNMIQESIKSNIKEMFSNNCSILKDTNYNNNIKSCNDVRFKDNRKYSKDNNKKDERNKIEYNEVKEKFNKAKNDYYKLNSSNKDKTQIELSISNYNNNQNKHLLNNNNKSKIIINNEQELTNSKNYNNQTVEDKTTNINKSLIKEKAYKNLNSKYNFDPYQIDTNNNNGDKDSKILCSDINNSQSFYTERLINKYANIDVSNRFSKMILSKDCNNKYETENNEKESLFYDYKDISISNSESVKSSVNNTLNKYLK